MQIQLTQLPPLSLYIHIPWCVQKCPYCDFNSHQANGELPENQYVKALLNDLASKLPLVWGRSIQTIFIGGGTPSLFSGRAIDQLLMGVRSLIKVSPFAEITLEMNPGTLDIANLVEYNNSGVNRISMGIQSMYSHHLQKLGRIHNVQDIYSSVEALSRIYNNYNLDLIYALPNQTVAELEDELSIVTKFGASHLSYYNLTIEPNTKFYINTPANLPDDDLTYAMQDVIIDKLAVNGYERYEVSAFAIKPQYAKHNLNYWRFGDYLGIGAGAHSKISTHAAILRLANYKNPAHYMNNMSSCIEINNKVDVADVNLEFAMNVFRLVDGFELKLYTEVTGLPLGYILPQLLLAQEKNFIELKLDKVVPTKLGLDFLNDLMLCFMST